MKTFLTTLLFLLCLMVSPSLKAQEQAKPIKAIGGDETIEKALEEFYDSARYYKVGVISPIDSLKSVRYIHADLNFLGDISPDGKTILLNKELLKYRNLSRVIIFRQFGKLYELEIEKKGHAVMGEHWDIDSRHEYIADFLLSRPYMKKEFFESLAEKAPIEKRL